MDRDIEAAEEIQMGVQHALMPLRDVALDNTPIVTARQRQARVTELQGVERALRRLLATLQGDQRLPGLRGTMWTVADLLETVEDMLRTLAAN